MIDISEGFEMDGRDYVCFKRLLFNGKDYLYLITVDMPVDIKFAEQMVVDGEPQLRIVGGIDEKQRLIEAFKAED